MIGWIRKLIKLYRQSFCRPHRWLYYGGIPHLELPAYARQCASCERSEFWIGVDRPIQWGLGHRWGWVWVPGWGKDEMEVARRISEEAAGLWTLVPPNPPELLS